VYPSVELDTSRRAGVAASQELFRKEGGYIVSRSSPL
jgi:hypothetical protein